MTDRAHPTPNVLFDVWRLSRRVDALLDRALTEADISPSDFGLYSLLAVDGPLTPSELARRSASPATTISQALQRLERRGHARRRPNPEDARSTLVELTDAGRDLHGRAAEPFVDVLAELGRELAGDAGPVRSALHRLEVAIAALMGEPPPDAPELPSPLAATADEELTPQQQRELQAFAAWLRWRG